MMSTEIIIPDKNIVGNITAIEIVKATCGVFAIVTISNAIAIPIIICSATAKKNIPNPENVKTPDSRLRLK